MDMRKLGALGQIHQYDFRGYKGRLFGVTDVHGYYGDLIEALRQVNFCAADGDVLLSTGDWVDRGPESHNVLDFLENEWVLSCRGNHEQMQIEAFESGYHGQCVSTNTLAMHGGNWSFDLPHEKQKAITDAFKGLPLSMEILTDWGVLGIIHAEVPYQSWSKWKDATVVELENHCIAEAQWARRRYRSKDDRPVEGIDRVLVGHTPTDSTNFEMLGNVIYADVGVHRNHNVKLVEINNKLFGENVYEQAGEARRSRSQRI